MFTFLSKFLPLFVYPLGFACLALLVVLIFWKHRKIAFIGVLLAFAFLYIGGNKYVAFSLARSLEWQYLPTETPKRADVIVVLGGATEPALAPRPEVELNGAVDRLVHGAVLYRQGIAPYVLLSGGDIDFLTLSTTSPAADMRSVMEMLGVPADAMWLQGKSQNTYEDALYSCALIKEKGAKTVILVTSALHMPRSVAVFKKQGCEVIPSPTDFTITEAAWSNLWAPDWQELVINLVPSYSNLSLTTKSLKEYIGWLTYRFQGWL
ncbi:MAG: YdcF family protein [Anaerolineaceae bacterium]